MNVSNNSTKLFIFALTRWALVIIIVILCIPEVLALLLALLAYVLRLPFEAPPEHFLNRFTYWLEIGTAAFGPYVLPVVLLLLLPVFLSKQYSRAVRVWMSVIVFLTVISILRFWYLAAHIH